MKDLLRFNICNIETSFIRNEDIPDLGARIQDCIPSHLEYACVYWSSHLCEAPYSRELSDQLSAFSYQKLLFWFEVLSLLKTFGRVAGQSLLYASIWAKVGTRYFQMLNVTYLDPLNKAKCRRSLFISK